jgi:hypothetical protein
MTPPTGITAAPQDPSQPLYRGRRAERFAAGPSLLPFSPPRHEAPSPVLPPAEPADALHALRPEPVRRSRQATTALRRRDLRLAGRAAEIIKRDRRRRWFAGATVLTVIGTIVIPSMIMNGSARAEVKTAGTMALSPGRGAIVDLGTQLTDTWAQTTFVLPALPQGGSLYLAVELRGAGNTSYVAKGRVFPDGAVNVGLSRIVGGKETSLGNKRIALKATAGTALNLGGYVSKAAPAKLGVRAWEGSSAPAWQLAANDSSAIGTGTVRASSYLSSSATAPLTLQYRGLTASGSPAATPVAPPTAAPTAGPVPSIPVVRPTNSPTGTATTITKPPTATTTTAPPAPANPGGGKAGAGNTGVPSGTKLTVHAGDLVISKAGATYEGLDVQGIVDVQAADVTIKNSIVRGRSNSPMAVKATNANVRNFRFVDSEVRIANGMQVDGIHGGNFTIQGVEVTGGVDSIKVTKDNARVEGSWLHSTVVYATSAQSNGKTHNDGIQVEGGSNITITGNTIGGADNAAIMVTTNAAATSNLTISKNSLGGGGCTINISPTKVSTIGPVSLTGNTFSRDSRVANCAVARTASTSMSDSNNVWTDGSPAKINVWG